jgi:hypothetical protein
MSYREFQQLSRKPHEDVPMRWRLGLSERLSATNLFYAQAAALCHFLVAQGKGAALLQWVQDLHHGRTQRGDSVSRTGIPAHELGPRILRWVRER